MGQETVAAICQRLPLARSWFARIWGEEGWLRTLCTKSDGLPMAVIIGITQMSMRSRPPLTLAMIQRPRSSQLRCTYSSTRAVRPCRAAITPPADTWTSGFADSIRLHGRMEGRERVRRRQSTLDHRDRKPTVPSSPPPAASTSPPRAQPAGRPASPLEHGNQNHGVARPPVQEMG